MVDLARDLWRSPGPTRPAQAGLPRQVVQDHVHMGTQWEQSAKQQRLASPDVCTASGSEQELLTDTL